MTKFSKTIKHQEKTELRKTSNNIANLKRKQVENITKRFRNVGLRSVKTEVREDQEVHIIDEEETQNNLDLSNRLIGVLYPGNVENVDNAIETLGGLKAIANVAGDDKRRLELRFRPKEFYCKPCCGDRDESIGILIKVKVQRIISSGPSCSRSIAEPLKEIFHTEVMGVTKLMFKFQSIVDFQYLPMDIKNRTDGSAQLDCIYNDLVISSLPDFSWITDGENLPGSSLFLPPPLYSRMDTEFNIIGRKVFNEDSEKKQIGEPPEEQDSSYDFFDQFRYMEKTYGKGDEYFLAPKIRKRHVGFGIAARFQDEVVPQKPASTTMKWIKLKFLESHLEIIAKLFTERPIWSRSALLYHLKINNEDLKYLLPSVAYYYQSGPWRCMWVRYGYDPRKDPPSRKYQTLDFRVRSGRAELQVKLKREYKSALLPYKTFGSSRNKAKVPYLSNSMLMSDKNEKESKSNSLKDNTFIFRVDVLPPSKQCLYQYCDILVPEIQAMLARLPDVNADQKCHEKNGWLPNGFDDQCREIMNKYCVKMIKTSLIEQRKKQMQESQKGDDDDCEYDDDGIEDLEESEDEEYDDIVEILSDDSEDESNEIFLNKTNDGDINEQASNAESVEATKS